MPLQVILQLVAVENGNHSFFQAFRCVFRAVAEIEVNQALAGDDVAPGASFDPGDLEGGWREEIIATVPEFLREGVQSRGNGMNRVFRQVRVGHVPLCALYCEIAMERAPAAVLDDIAHLTGAGRFTNQAPVDFFIPGFQGFHHFHGAVLGRTFLVTGDQQGNRAPMIGMVCHKPLAGCDKGRQAAFHVGCAPAMKKAIVNHRLERRMTPVFLRTGGHNICMACKRQQGAFRTLAGPKVVGFAKAQGLALEAKGREPRHHQFLTAGVVRGNGWPADQVNGELEGRGKLCGISCLHAVLRSARWRTCWSCIQPRQSGCYGGTEDPACWPNPVP